MSRTVATPHVKIAWSTGTSGAFLIGTSTIGGTDVLPGRYGPAAVAFTDETARVKEASGRRGRDATLASMSEGTCRIVLKDTNGRFNPDNPASPLAGQLVPGRPVQVTATHLGVTYGLFYGVISSLESHPNRNERECVLDCVDLFEWLNVSYPVFTTGVSTVGAVIGFILDAIFFTGASYRRLDTGSTIPSFVADGSRTALQLIEELLTVDMGTFFIDGNGAATYYARTARFGATNPRLLLSSPFVTIDALTGTTLASLAPRVDLASIVNRQRVTREGGSEQTAQNTTSQTTYGIREGSAITSSYLYDDAQAGNLAGFLVQLQKDPRSPARDVELLNRDDGSIIQQLYLEVGDRVSVSETVGGTSFNGIIDAVNWELWGGAQFHRTTFLVSKRTAPTWFTIGTSTLGGTHVLGY